MCVCSAALSGAWRSAGAEGGGEARTQGSVGAGGEARVSRAIRVAVGGPWVLPALRVSCGLISELRGYVQGLRRSI